MANLDINIDDKLDEEISRLAVKHYGDDSEASQRRLIETALMMRIFWSNSVEKEQQETDDTISHWEFEEPKVNENYSDIIGDWLFRR